jgi:hypothetical protein
MNFGRLLQGRFDPVIDDTCFGAVEAYEVP